jgi:hypothetical protein
MFRRWFSKREKLEPSDGVVVLRERGQQIHLREDIIPSIIRVTTDGVAMTIDAPVGHDI